MTLLSGALRRSGPLKHPDVLLSALTRLLSRDASDRVEVVLDDHTSARQVPARVDDDVVATFVAGCARRP